MESNVFVQVVDIRGNEREILGYDVERYSYFDKLIVTIAE